MNRFSLGLLARITASAAVLVAVIGVATFPAAADTTQPAPGQARVWFYRVFFPEDTGGMPAVAMNGNTVGYARAGYIFYRDVPAGPYNVTVASFGVDTNQAQQVVLAPGEQIYFAIQSDPLRENRRGYRRPTYYVGYEPSSIAAIHVSQMRLGSGT